MKNKPNTSNNLDICILTAGAFELLGECLNSIKEEIKDIPSNVYLLDNGSPFERRKQFEDLFNHPIITESKRLGMNVGYPRGANTVIRMGTNRRFLFVSDDITFLPGSIHSMIKTMDEDPKIAICGMKLIFPRTSTEPGRPAGKVQHVGHTINLRGEVIHPFIGWSSDNPKTCISGERISVTGAAFMGQRSMFQKARGFNEDYGKGYFEDVEMCLNIRDLGGRIWVDCNAWGEHWVGATMQMLNNSNLQENGMMFMQRNRQRITWTDWEIR